MNATIITLSLIFVTGCKSQPVNADSDPVPVASPSVQVPGLKPIALCNDGSFSYALSPRLACLDNCTDHGGVKQWYPYGKGPVR